MGAFDRDFGMCGANVLSPYGDLVAVHRLEYSWFDCLFYV